MKVASIELLYALLTFGSCDSLGPGCTPLFATGDDGTTSQSSGSDTTTANPILTTDGTSGSTSHSEGTAAGTASESNYASDSETKVWENGASETSGIVDTSSSGGEVVTASSTQTYSSDDSDMAAAAATASSDDGPEESSDDGDMTAAATTTPASSDDGPEDPSDTSLTSPPLSCGNGIIEPGEECDPGCGYSGGWICLNYYCKLECSGYYERPFAECVVGEDPVCP